MNWETWEKIRIAETNSWNGQLRLRRGWQSRNDTRGVYLAVLQCIWQCVELVVLTFQKTFKGKNLKQACVCVCVCVCVCLCSSTSWFLPAARHLWYAWEVRINDLLLWAFSGSFCQVPSSLSSNLSHFTSKDENYSRPPTGEKTIWYNVLREKMIYIDIGYKSVWFKPTTYEKILKIRKLL